MPIVIAHRGASAYHPENSLAAFRAAVDLGADGIELDVHATADGVIVVHHDATIGGRRIAHLRHAELAGHTLPNGERIPTLSEAFEAIGPGVIVFVEVKGMPAALDEHLVDTIDRAPVPTSVHIHAFDHRIVRRLLDRRPATLGGVLAVSYPLDPATPVRAAGATALWQHEAYVDRALVDTLHDIRARLYAWTVDDESRMAELVDMQVDGLCTNTPDVARRIIP